MQNRLIPTLIVGILFAIAIPAAHPSVVTNPVQFNPAGTLLTRIDPYSGGNMTTSGGSVYYPLTTVFDPVNKYLYTVELFGEISVFDTVTNKTLPEIILQNQVTTTALYDPTNGYLYVATIGHPYQSDPGHILGINTTTGQVVVNLTSIMEPGGMAIDTANNHLFVGGIAEGTGIQVFDLSTNTALTTISTNGSFEEGTFDPSNGKAYFVDGDYNRLVVVDATTDKITSTMSTKDAPAEVLFDPVNDNVYVSGYFYELNASLYAHVLGFNSADSLVMNMTMSSYPQSMFIDSNSGLVYFVGYYPSGLEYNISAIDPSTNEIVHSLNTVQQVTISSPETENGLAYLITNGEAVIPFNTQKFAFTGIFALFAAPEAISYNAHDKTMDVYSVLYGSNTSLLSVISGEKVVSSMTFGPSPSNTSSSPALVVSSSSGFAYISPGNGTVVVVNSTAASVVGTIRTKGAIDSMAYDPADNTLLILLTQGGKGAVESVNLTSGTETSIPLGFAPTTMAYDQSHDLLLVGGTAPDGLTIVSAASMQVLGSYALSVNGAGVIPSSLTYDPHDNLIYVEDSQDNLLLSVNETSGQEVYYNQQAQGFSVLYDEANGYVYVALPEGALVVDGSVDVTLGSVTVGQSATCMALDPANGYLYFGDSFPGTVPIVEPGPGIPSSVTAVVTTTETTTVSPVSTVTTTSTLTLVSTTTVPLTSTSTVTATSTVSSQFTATTSVTVTAPASTAFPGLDIGLGAVVAVLAVAVCVLSYFAIRRR